MSHFQIRIFFTKLSRDLRIGILGYARTRSTLILILIFFVRHIWILFFPSGAYFYVARADARARSYAHSTRRRNKTRDQIWISFEFHRNQGFALFFIGRERVARARLLFASMQLRLKKSQTIERMSRNGVKGGINILTGFNWILSKQRGCLWKSDSHFYKETRVSCIIGERQDFCCFVLICIEENPFNLRGIEPESNYSDTSRALHNYTKWNTFVFHCIGKV